MSKSESLWFVLDHAKKELFQPHTNKGTKYCWPRKRDAKGSVTYNRRYGYSGRAPSENVEYVELPINYQTLKLLAVVLNDPGPE